MRSWRYLAARRISNSGLMIHRPLNVVRGLRVWPVFAFDSRVDGVKEVSGRSLLL